MKVIPLHNRVLVRVGKVEERSKGGVLLPQSAQEDSHIGEVLAVGPGGWLQNGQQIPVAVKVGQTVLVSILRQKVPGEKGLYLVPESDVTAIIED